ncbi:RsmE family RNA methyltransferase [uncultured Desulfobulbus sp.]|uniref:RsmE family RNA methyltransferase n=1 Tax=uncultured Desulfobulbus sp. TaxID=239745 RepID=UPI0029C925F1|nr:RsmE family RNA methyltransferase [uncultured Desulfobulbus sp.]
MRRFFLPAQSRTDTRIAITGPEARHIASVLRLRPGQTVEFFDGQGGVYAALLQTADKNLVTATVTETWREDAATKAPLTLAQCLLKGKKMDLLVQKATELGVEAFLPVVSKYCENHGDRDHQVERWQRIMIEACKQSHRTTPMTILPAASLIQVDFTPFSHRLAAWEGEQQAALSTTFADHPGAICLLLGPEGGLHAEDLQVLHRWNFTTFSLGPRILRGETAALAAMAIVQYHAGALQPAAGHALSSLEAASE